MIASGYHFRSLRTRKGTTIATASGLALAAFVFASVLMLSNGIETTMGSAGRPNVAVILRKGAESETYSMFSQAAVRTILTAQEIARGNDGHPAGVAELVVVVGMQKSGTATFGQVTVRGVLPASRHFHPNIKIVAGRAPNPATDEVMLGRALRGRYQGADLNGSVLLAKNRHFKVVGIFTAEGASYESEIWADIDSVRTATGRQSLVSSVRVKLNSRDQLGALRQRVESDRQLSVKVLAEHDYYTQLSLGTRVFIFALGGMITVVFSLGAILGATITMHASVANRKREIGILRALGFSKTGILVGFVMESILLAGAGGLLGAGLSLLMGLVEFKTTNFSSWSEVTFKLEPTVETVVASVLFAAAMGGISGFFPALSASRMSILKALRE